MPAFVVRELCEGCGACARACPRGAIEVVGGKALVTASKCDDCEICMENCLNGAITFVAAHAASS